jgi:hypothetical protein
MSIGEFLTGGLRMDQAGRGARQSMLPESWRVGPKAVFTIC